MRDVAVRAKELRFEVDLDANGELTEETAVALAPPAEWKPEHLLLAALDDTNSAASWALASLGVDLDELREKLRSAKISGTSDEPPEQAGRRQMSIQVTDEILTIVATDPIIVEAGKEALRAANARAAAAVHSKGDGPLDEESASDESSGEETGGKSATATVIRGDHPAADGLANVWLELRETLNTIADPARDRRVVSARKLQGTSDPALQGASDPADPAEETRPDEPDEPEAAGS